jgi:two-component system invasion response regulator UvrY
MVRILLASPHRPLSAALVEYLRTGKVLCEEAASAEDLYDHLQRHQWDVLILDLSLPQRTKLQSVQTLHSRYPTLPILATSLTVNIPAEYWQEAGASGFVPKAKLSTELIEAVKVISEGGKYFSTEGAEGTIR